MTVGVRLDEAAWGLLRQAMDVYQHDARAVGRLRHQVARLEQPLRIAVAGPWRAGKSTVLNALMGRRSRRSRARTASSPGTRMVLRRTPPPTRWASLPRS